MRSGLVETLLPRLAIDVARPLAPARLFDRAVIDLRLEIGFGGGERLAGEAAAHPDVGFLGCEPFVNGTAKLLAEIAARRLDNIRLHAGDAADLIEALPEACLGRVEILYPDPWPKRRQRKRRFLSDAMLARLARVMRPGAELRFATDIDDYSGWTLSRVARSESFAWSAEGMAGWTLPWAGWTPTRYEAKARREGRRSAYLTFVRR